VKSESERESCCQSMAVRANGGLSRGKGKAVGSGLDFHWAWKMEGRDEASMVKLRDILFLGGFWKCVLRVCVVCGREVRDCESWVAVMMALERWPS